MVFVGNSLIVSDMVLPISVYDNNVAWQETTAHLQDGNCNKSGHLTVEMRQMLVRRYYFD